MIHRTIALMGAALILFVSVSSVQASIKRYELADHPDGNARSPLYSLRLDGLYSFDSDDIFTFSSTANGARMTLEYNDQDTLNNGDDTIRISGQVYGGLDVGDNWDPNFKGLWNVDFSYTKNIVASTGLSLEVTSQDAAGNYGTISPTFTSIPTSHADTININANEIINLVDKDNTKFSFKFNTDDHRLSDHDLPYPDTFVGWGWLDHSGKDHISASDWLFIASEIPVPSSTTLDEVPEPASVAVWSVLALVGSNVVSRKRRR